MKQDKKQQYYDQIYTSAEKYRTHYKDSIYFVLWTQAIQFIREMPSPKILEVGCGTGQFAQYLFDQGYRDYHGFDFSPEAIKIAKRSVNQQFDVGDALSRDSYTPDYNLVIAQEILEHIRDDFGILRNIKEGSAIIFSLPTFDDPAHFRWFLKPREIEKRYFRLIDIRKIIRIHDWFICWGIIGKYEPNLLHAIFKTRRKIDPAFIKDIVKEMLPAWLRRLLKSMMGTGKTN